MFSETTMSTLILILGDLISFGLKAAIVVLVIGAFFLLIAFLIARAQQNNELEVEPLHTKLKDIGFFLRSFRLNKDDAKAEAKARKEEKKKASKDDGKKKVLYVLEFQGDIKATQTEALREEVTAILQAAQPGDEVLCKVESPGGVVHGYGLAAAQLIRLREAGLKLVVSVDEVAASGGYLMACVAHQILGAPFAIVGSIGVVAQVPNFNRVLRKYDVDYHEYTAGEFKRTVSLFGPITPKGEEKFLHQLEETHALFKQFVQKYRTQLDISKVATGEYWYGEQALQLGLIDKIQTSDDFVLEKLKEDASILLVSYNKPRSLQEKISEMMSIAAEKTLLKFWTRMEKQKFF